jgi:hypothetical protein
MDNPTNADLYGVLMGIKEDIGGLKEGGRLQLLGLQNHSGRLDALESNADKQKGAAKVWSMVGTSVAGIAGALITIGTTWWLKK